MGIGYFERVRKKGGLEQSRAVPGLVGLVRRYFVVPMLLSVKLVSYSGRVIPRLAGGGPAILVVPHKDKCLSQSFGEFIEHNRCKLEVVQLFAGPFVQRHSGSSLQRGRNKQRKLKTATLKLKLFHSLQTYQFQISPASWQEILHHTVWWTWLFIAYSDKRLLYYQSSLPHLCISTKNRRAILPIHWPHFASLSRDQSPKSNARMQAVLPSLDNPVERDRDIDHRGEFQLILFALFISLYWSFHSPRVYRQEQSTTAVLWDISSEDTSHRET